MALITLDKNQLLEPQGIQVVDQLAKTVFAARTRNGTPVVLKAGSNTPLDNILVNNEREVFNAISPHRNICRPIDYFIVNSISGDIPVLAFPYIEGKGLDEAVVEYYCDNDGDFKFFNALSGGLAGLKHIHDCGFLHLDIKPQNIMVDSSGTGILIDLGGSRRENGDCPKDLAGVSYGTLDYLPPEILPNIGISRKSDVYQFGATIVACLTGHTPYPLIEIGGYVMPAWNNPIDLEKACPSLREYTALRDILERARAKKPDQRPAVDELSALVNDHAEFFRAHPEHIRLLPKNTYARGKCEDYEEDVHIE